MSRIGFFSTTNHRQCSDVELFCHFQGLLSEKGSEDPGNENDSPPPTMATSHCMSRDVEVASCSFSTSAVKLSVDLIWDASYSKGVGIVGS